MPFIIDPKTKQRIQLDAQGQVATPARTSQAPSAVNSSAVNQPLQATKPQPASFVGNFLKSLFQSTLDRGRDVVGGLYAGNMAVPEIIQRVTVDPQNKSKTFDREIQRGLSIVSEKGREAMLAEDVKKPLIHGVKTGLEAGQYMIPAGKTLKAITAGGAVSGAMSALAQDDVNAGDVALSTVGGAGGSVLLGKALPGLLNITKEGTSKVIKSSVGKVAGHLKDTAEQSVVKATPTAWRNALTEHGIDVNSLAMKYFKGARGYDDVLGTVAERGNGGSLQKALNTAEKRLQKAVTSYGSTARVSLDDFAKDINVQLRELKKVAGNQETVDKLGSLLKEQIKIYKKGATAKQLLDMKRIADSKFGKAVVDEEAGSVSAQFQKVLANYARQKLHRLFPEIGDALDTQTEILTLKPLLNHARAIERTSGSTIRSGKIGNVELLNPFSWQNLIGTYASDPARASRLWDRVNTLENLGSGIEDVSILPQLANDKVRSGAIVAGRKGGSELLSSEDEQEEHQQYEADDTENNPANEDGGSYPDHDGANIPQPEMESPQTNAFSGMTKQEVLTKAVQEGASKADLIELSEIYDIVTANSQKPEDFLQEEQTSLAFTPDQLEVAMQNAVMAGDDKAYSQLTKMYEIAVARETRLAKLAETNAKSDKPSAGDSAVSAVQQLQVLFGRGNAENVGTDQDLALGGGGSLTERAGAKTAGVTKKFTDPDYINDLEIFQNQATNVLGLITQAFGSGTPQDAEAQRLIKSIPGAGTPDKVAKAWFTNLEDLLRRTNVQAPSIEDTSQLIEK